MKLKVKLFGKNVFQENSAYSKKVDYANYYKITHECKNCNAINVIYVKKGVHVNDIATSVKCINCGNRLEKR
jgi:RNase P subunit RPR2